MPEHQNQPDLDAITVTFNPAIDHTIWLERLQPGRVHRAKSARLDAGGKGVNVSINLAMVGLKTAATGFVGKSNAAVFEQRFASLQIEDRMVRIEGGTRIGTKVVEESLDQTTDINLPGSTPESSDWDALFHTLDELCSRGKWLVLAGSLPPNIDAQIYAQIMQRYQHQPLHIALDTSEQALQQTLKHATPSLIKPNLHELQQMTGQSYDSHQAVLQALRKPPFNRLGTVVVSLGSEGALAVEGDQAVWAKPPRVKVKSTVGAGDAMLSGMIAGQARQLSLPERLRLATAFSLAAITHSDRGVQSRQRVESFLPQITLSQLN